VENFFFLKKKKTEKKEEFRKLWKKTADAAPEGYEAASDHIGPVYDLDFREKTGLEKMFQKGPFLKDQNHDFLPDALDVKLVLPEDASDAMFLAACDLAYRFGMETTGYEGTILAGAGYKGNQIIFEKADQTELVLGETDCDGVKVYLHGDGEALTAFTARLCNTFLLRPPTGIHILSRTFSDRICNCKLLHLRPLFSALRSSAAIRKPHRRRFLFPVKLSVRQAGRPLRVG